jgi:hypothetical protein
MTIKEFYLESYPTDELGLELSEVATFEGLLDRLFNGDDVYRYIGVADSIIRERLFEELAKGCDRSYDYIYKLWIDN